MIIASIIASIIDFIIAFIIAFILVIKHAPRTEIPDRPRRVRRVFSSGNMTLIESLQRLQPYFA